MNKTSLWLVAALLGTATLAQAQTAPQAGASMPRIEKAENKAEADGKVTRKERAALKARQDKASRNIAKQKHDAQTAAAKP